MNEKIADNIVRISELLQKTTEILKHHDTTIQLLTERIKALEKDAHEPVDIIETVKQAIRNGEILLTEETVEKSVAVVGAPGVKVLTDDAEKTAAWLRNRIQELRIDHPEAAYERQLELEAVEAEIAERRSVQQVAP